MMEDMDLAPTPEITTDDVSSVAVVGTCLILVLCFLLAVIFAVCRCRSRCRAEEPKLNKFTILPPPIITTTSKPSLFHPSELGVHNESFIKDYDIKSKSCSDILSRSRLYDPHLTKGILDKSRELLNYDVSSSDASTQDFNHNLYHLGQHSREDHDTVDVPPGLVSYINDYTDRSSYTILSDTSPNPTWSIDALVIVGDTTESQYFAPERAHHYESTMSTDTAAFEAGQANKYLGANNDIAVLSQSEMSINVRSCPNSPIVSRTPCFIRRQIPSLDESDTTGAKSEPHIGVVMIGSGDDVTISSQRSVSSTSETTQQHRYGSEISTFF